MKANETVRRNFTLLCFKVPMSFYFRKRNPDAFHLKLQQLNHHHHFFSGDGKTVLWREDYLGAIPFLSRETPGLYTGGIPVLLPFTESVFFTHQR